MNDIRTFSKMDGAAGFAKSSHLPTTGTESLLSSSNSLLSVCDSPWSTRPFVDPLAKSNQKLSTMSAPKYHVAALHGQVVVL